MWEYNYSIPNDELYHYGVKGMKWGVRRYQNPDGTLTSAGKKHYGVDKTKSSSSKKLFGKNKKEKDKSSSKEGSKNVTTNRKKSVKDMSDDEIKARINRLQLEQSYNKLLAEQNPKKTSATKKLVQDVVRSSARNIGTQAVTYAMGAALNEAVKRSGYKDPYDENGKSKGVVNPKKGQKDKR